MPAWHGVRPQTHPGCTQRSASDATAVINEVVPIVNQHGSALGRCLVERGIPVWPSTSAPSMHGAAPAWAGGVRGHASGSRHRLKNNCFWVWLAYLWARFASDRLRHARRTSAPRDRHGPNSPEHRPEQALGQLALLSLYRTHRQSPVAARTRRLFGRPTQGPSSRFGDVIDWATHPPCRDD